MALKREKNCEKRQPQKKKKIQKALRMTTILTLITRVSGAADEDAINTIMILYWERYR